jgi:hypothetical protein
MQFKKHIANILTLIAGVVIMLHLFISHNHFDIDDIGNRSEYQYEKVGQDCSHCECTVLDVLYPIRKLTINHFITEKSRVFDIYTYKSVEFNFYNSIYSFIKIREIKKYSFIDIFINISPRASPLV